jgi:hypothetical protein
LKADCEICCSLNAIKILTKKENTLRKLTILTVAILMFFAVSTFAQDITLTTKFRSAYLGSTGGMFYDDIVQQGDITASWKNGWLVNAWASTSFNDKKDFGKEIDFTVGKNGNLGDIDYYTDFEYFLVQGKDVANWNGELSKSFNGGLISPFIRAEAYFPTQTGGLRKGLMGVFGVKSNFKVSPKISISLGVQTRKDSGCFGNDAGVLGQGFIRTGFAINDKWTVIPGIMGMIPLSHRTDGRVAATATEIGVSYRWR